MTISGLGTSASTQRRSTIACSSGAWAGVTGSARGRLRRSVIDPPMPMAAAIAKAATSLKGARATMAAAQASTISGVHTAASSIRA